MTKDIILTISGLHATDGESTDPVEIITPGQYYFKGGKHYVLFEEVMEGLDGKLKSTIKFSEQQLELIRNGAASSRMIFEREREHRMFYQTPMGPLDLSVYTEEFDVYRSEAQINIHITYVLKAEDTVITESTVNMNICQKELKEFIQE